MFACLCRWRLRPFFAGNLTSKKFRLCRPSNKQTNRIVQTSNLRKINHSLKKASIFRNLEVFQILRESSTLSLSQINNRLRRARRKFGPRGYTTCVRPNHIFSRLCIRSLTLRKVNERQCVPWLPAFWNLSWQSTSSTTRPRRRWLCCQKRNDW